MNTSKDNNLIKPELIIFDNDGVLIDSEILWHQHCVAYFKDRGVAISIDESIQFFSFRQENCLSKLITDKDLINIRALTESSYPQLLQPVSGMKTLLEKLLRLNYKLCVASNADKAYIFNSLIMTQLIQYFEPNHLFSVDLVGKSKLAPDLLLYIAEYFNVPSSCCLVIEDHALGIRAARLAHMPVWGFMGGKHAKHKEYLQWLSAESPDKIVRNASDFQKELRE